MRTIIAGDRECEDYNVLLKALSLAEKEGIVPSVVLSGMARGADKLGEQYAKDNNLPLEKFAAKWDEIEGKPKAEIKENKWKKKYWVRAGFARNQDMADNAEALVALDFGGNGTKDMIKRAEEKGLKVFVYSPTTGSTVDFWA